MGELFIFVVLFRLVVELITLTVDIMNGLFKAIFGLFGIFFDR